VWLIYGATGPLGRAICRIALARGDKITGGGRKNGDEEERRHGGDAKCLGMVCEVRVQSSVQACVDKTIAHWGQVDIVVK